MRVHNSQAYRKIELSTERISRILEPREMLPSFKTGFNMVNVVSSVLSWRVSQAWNPRQINSPAHVLEAGDCLKLLSIYFGLSVDATGFVISLVFSSLISRP